jgi:hypothetical protein
MENRNVKYVKVTTYFDLKEGEDLIELLNRLKKSTLVKTSDESYIEMYDHDDVEIED